MQTDGALSSYETDRLVAIEAKNLAPQHAFFLVRGSIGHSYRAVKAVQGPVKEGATRLDTTGGSRRYMYKDRRYPG